ncbi:cupin [Streptomyces sulfonofaciens]|uniref:Cupin n=1 Tax=Streptomyces sulfonofaciens TaxID=68272 RepID=A0A919G9I3_9ACTN|nr:cupin domain-containing protein [Streptomyces sulfonofaciens]GHH80254.1 cupin [Streptomyces sulfonofaciens]
MKQPGITVEDLVDHYGLEPMPLEGGRFRRTWAGPEDGAGRPAGSAIIALLSPDDDHFSAMHRLPGDEVWHFYLGAPLELLLLEQDGTARVVLLGHDLRAGQHVQYTVPAGTWMGGRVTEPGAWSLIGCTMAPGFLSCDYEGGTAEDLCERYPQQAERIRSLCRPGAALRHPANSEGAVVPAGAR